jgi:hypothetical protein
MRLITVRYFCHFIYKAGIAFRSILQEAVGKAQTWSWSRDFFTVIPLELGND